MMSLAIETPVNMSDSTCHSLHGFQPSLVRSPRAWLVACTLFWAPCAQVLAGLGRIKRAKTNVGILFGGLGCCQRAKRPMLIGCSLFPSLCEQSTTPIVCLPTEGHSHWDVLTTFKHWWAYLQTVALQHIVITILGTNHCITKQAHADNTP
jgi:hypothetical protein